MFKEGDIVQSKTGGPKMVIHKVEDNQLWCIRMDDSLKKELIVAVDAVEPYREEGPFGVC
ncbi:hypothetical protein AU509_02115 [Lonsdalea britannica]|uniref:DUF2158 domain-containing protein n=1 Tax=Lonsdalea britannica TaxID=1082704 RepID=A0AAD0SJ23_9GAMM|nr:DUF2158 domain-containing protein [Lonsdalea britannica]AXW88106.1 DUF2158 domain-containing protein [Lonsdalea britannica]OSN00227.1 hypothetical protein AU509_02115 [Lonsdalea britannica]